MKKTAIVTGASSGMGKESAYQITDRYSGLDEIWLIARRTVNLENVGKMLPVPSRILSMDLSEPESFTRLQTLLESEQPNVKILVNAAGFGKIGEFDRTDPSDEAGMIRVNCEALALLTRMILPYMSRSSRIIMFASAAAFLPQPGFAVYAATKAFVLSSSRALNAELKNRGIVVTAVCPGPVDTEFFSAAGYKSGISPFKKLFMADPRKVVRRALADSAGGKSISVYGIPMKLAGIIAKFFPQNALIRLMHGIYSQGSDT